MCGIAGARNDWLIEQGLDPAVAIAQATAELSWRGPDGQATEQAGDWWLGCARLAISGPNARQPVVRRGGRFAGVMNGAITNARELWPMFSKRAGARPAPPNDAWLPLLAVAADRADALASLRGHHAYAVLDTLTGELTLGQDRFAEKPLHCLVARVAGRWQLVAFASTHAALQVLGMPAVKSNRRLAQWFRFGWSEQRAHRFSSRLRLDSLPMRGKPMRAASNQPSWCQPIPCDAPTQPATAPATGLREQLIASVRRCIDSPSAAALFLSGGVDSSCLALALGSIGAATPAYQFRAAGASSLERDAAQAVAKAAGLPLHHVDCGPEVLDSLPHLTKLAGQPLGDPSILAVHAVAQRAANDGVRIMLGGEGADELLLGYQRYRALSKLPRLRTLAALRGFGSGWSTHKVSRMWRAMVAKNPIRALLAVTPPAFAKSVLAKELAARRCWHDAEPMPDASISLGLAARADDVDNYLPRDLLPKVDIALMAAGIEGRCPYLEAGIEPFGQDLTAIGKRALREAFRSELPSAVQQLPKVGFSLPLDDWFRRDPALLEVLADPRSRQRDHLQPGGLALALDRHRSGRSNLGHALYLLLAYELHLRSRVA